MKTEIITTILAIASLGTFANAATISINITDGGAGVASNAASTGGASLAGHWNNIRNNGTAGTGTTVTALKDDSGASTTVGITQSANVGGAFNATSTGFSGTIGNGFMQNYSDSTAAYTYSLTNVNAGVGALYDVYIYSARVHANAGVSKFTVNGTDQFILNENPLGDYVLSGHASAAAANTNKNDGNYVLFTNVSLDTLVIGVEGLADTTGNGGTIANINGVQLVAVTVPEPSSTALLGLGGLALILRRRK